MVRLIAFLLSTLLLSPLLSAESLELDKRKRDQLKKETVYAIDLIQNYHYKQTKFQDLDPIEVLDGYMEDLDNTRMFLL
ncbi:MAG: hypothetical protein RL648_21, partial [Verrucomicrobiota bacterium]